MVSMFVGYQDCVYLLRINIQPYEAFDCFFDAKPAIHHQQCIAIGYQCRIPGTAAAQRSKFQSRPQLCLKFTKLLLTIKANRLMIAMSKFVFIANTAKSQLKRAKNERKLEYEHICCLYQVPPNNPQHIFCFVSR